MHVTEVTNNIYRFSANVGKDLLFEGMWPIPHGLSMNSFLVKGEKCVLIDGVCGWDGVPETLLKQLNSFGINPGDIKYVILNHLEPDHTGWLPHFRKLNDNFTLVATKRGLEMAENFYDIKVRTRAVTSGDSIDLGDGKVLSFEEIPNVHWPETMVTYESSTGTLFTCDAFGSFGAISQSPYDDILSPEELHFFEGETLRYYSNILASFTGPVSKAIGKIRGMNPKIIAPAHGIVWRENPETIIDLYDRYTSYSHGAAEKEVTVIWGSMYGNTENAANHLVEGILSEGVKAHVHKVPETHVSHIIASAWKSSGIVIAAPTYEYNLFPPMAVALDELGRKKIKKKLALRLGSYGWSGGAGKEVNEIMERWKMNWEFIDTVEFKGAPNKENLQALFESGKAFARAIKESHVANGKAA